MLAYRDLICEDEQAEFPKHVTVEFFDKTLCFNLFSL